MVRAQDVSFCRGGLVGAKTSKNMFFYVILCVPAPRSRRNGPPTVDSPPCARELEGPRAELDPQGVSAVVF